MKKKIFGIGFHKTGTKTLKKALEILGFSVSGPNATHDKDISNHLYDVVDTLVDKYDAFQDNPWPLVYEYLDKKYPNSKFILTVRNEIDWIESVVRYFGAKTTPMREMIYGVGSPIGHEEVYLQRYNDHNKKVMEYFYNRKNDLLILDLTQGDSWEKICPFLEKDFPTIPFPHENKGNK